MSTATGSSTSVRTEGGSHGAVAGTIHGGVQNNYYQVPEDASPAEKLTFARSFLASGQATTARRLLAEVTAHIRDSNEVWFSWLLAFLSRRTLSELTPEDRDCWTVNVKHIQSLPRDRWSLGIDVVRRLAEASQSRSTDGTTASAVLSDIDRLDDEMRSDVLWHLERVLQGSLKDELWHRGVEQAEADRTADFRRQRVWKFFEPDPARPRVCRVRPADVSGGHVGLALVMTVVAAAALGTIGWLALQRNDTSALVALMVAAVAGGVAVVNAAEWRFRVDRVVTENRQRRSVRFPSDAARPGGFAHKVDRMYVSYAKRYAPEDGAERAAWLLDAYAPLSRLRDDLVEAYRETRIDAGRVKWLIRFQVREVRRQWGSGTLLDPRQRWRVPASVKARTAAGVAVAVVGVLWGVQAAAREDVLRAAGAVVAMVIAACTAVVVGLRILAEQKRVAAEEADGRQRMTTYWFEFQRWQHRLADRPTDMEMAQWLECDRRILLQRAMHMYQLKWSDIRAYASLEARGDGAEKARAKNGPWRYSRYKLLVFLLTADGVRQVTVELDFAESTFHQWERTNYRYDAVAAVRVSLQDNGAREFQLFLVNGDDIPVAVTEAGRAGVDEDSRTLAEGAQDATGLRNTLFVLEGLAAEGRRWWKGPAYRRAG